MTNHINKNTCNYKYYLTHQIRFCFFFSVYPKLQFYDKKVEGNWQPLIRGDDHSFRNDIRNNALFIHYLKHIKSQLVYKKFTRIKKIVL